MKQPLRTVCAVFYAVACCAGQTPNTTTKIPTPLTSPSQVQNTAPSQPPSPAGTASQDNKPPDSNEVKPGCDVEKLPPAEFGAAKPYVIGSLDVLNITVWNSPNLSGFFTVGPDGMISFPLLGLLKADGATQQDLTHTIRGKLSNTVFECPPEVNIQVVKVNSKKYFVYGGVGRPGEFALDKEMSVMDALAICGGFTAFGNPKKIVILRGDTKFPFNYKDVSHGKNREQDIKLQNGDRIIVPE